MYCKLSLVYDVLISRFRGVLISRSQYKVLILRVYIFARYPFPTAIIEIFAWGVIFMILHFYEDFPQHENYTKT